MSNKTTDSETVHEQLPIQKNKSGVTPVIYVISLVVVLSIGVFVGLKASNYPQLLPSWTKTTSSGLDLSSVQKTYTLLNEKFDGTVDQQKLVEGASRGMVDAAGDPYTVYFDKKEAESFDSDLSGIFQGIGAELDRRDDKLIVVSPLADSPAEKAGLKPKDIIAKVNDEDSSQWSADKAVSKIRGKEGTTVKLTIVRGEEVKNISITRAVITSPSVKSEVRGTTGIITISRFGEDTTALTRKAAYSFQEQGVKDIILDLRGNGGGYLQSAQDIASLWLKKGVSIVDERRGDKVIDSHKATGDAPLIGIPTVVLIDGGSASASEIVAGALQDNKVATLVGEKSFGKGSVQSIVDLQNGAKLKVTIAKWYTPNGKNISKHGITPDVKVTYGADATRDNDPQLNKALEVVKNR